MPVEGQARRVVTPLTTRDKRMIAGVILAVVATVLGALAFSHDSGTVPIPAGCVTADVAGSVGGMTLRDCGPSAKRFCATRGNSAPGVASQCRRLGYPLSST
jgi:hypothetical protein